MVTLEELKAMVLTLQKKIDKLEKPAQWEPRGGGYWVCGWGDVFDGEPITRTSKFGVERQTAEAAEKASAAMRTHNRLLAYVDEFGGDWEADWENSEQLKYRVYYGYISKLWGRDFSQTLCTNGTVYMSKDCAEGLAAKLNSGEVVL